MAARLQMESAERHETDRSQRDAESIHGLEAQLKESEAFSLNAQQEIESLSHELNDVGRQSSDVVNQWKGEQLVLI